MRLERIRAPACCRRAHHDHGYRVEFRVVETANRRHDIEPVVVVDRLDEHDSGRLTQHGLVCVAQVVGDHDVEPFGTSGVDQHVGDLSGWSKDHNRFGTCCTGDRGDRRRSSSGGEPGATVGVATECDRHPFCSSEDLAVVPGRFGMGTGSLHKCVHLVVGALRVVVVQRHACNVGPPRHVDDVLDRAVAPADMVAELRREVLRVVDQQIGAGEPGRMRIVVAVSSDVAPGGQVVVVGLMVGCVHDHRTIDLESVAEGERRMVEEPGVDVDVVDVEHAFDEVLVDDRGGELIDRHRKVGVLHLTGEDLRQRAAEAAGARDAPTASLLEQRREERQTLDVVPVGVADEDVAVDRCPVGVLDQLLAERMRSGTAVDDHQRSRI